MVTRFLDMLRGLPKRKRLMTAIGYVVVIGLVAAIVLGVMNGLIADGEWSFGWSSYRYDETGYEIGSGTVPTRSITSLEIDWIDGEVQVLLCDDTYISVTEDAGGATADSAFLRHRVLDDGKTLSIKYRKSAAFLGCGGSGLHKNLVVRIPRSMANLQSLTLRSEASVIKISDISAQSVSVTSRSGSVTLSGGEFGTLSVSTTSAPVTVDASVSGSAAISTKGGNISFATKLSPSKIDLNTKKGNAVLVLPENCGYTLTVDADMNKFACDQSLTEKADGTYLYGGGECAVNLTVPKGTISVSTQKNG